MENQLLSAILERIELGYTQEKILDELHAAGYSVDESQAAYETASAMGGEVAEVGSADGQTSASWASESTSDSESGPGEEVSASSPEDNTVLPKKDTPDTLPTTMFFYVGLGLAVLIGLFVLAVWLFDNQRYLDIFPF